MKLNRSIFAAVLAFAVPIYYAVDSVFFYRRYLNWHLKYTPSPIPAAPEDILGFGFWVTWSVLFLVPFLIACTIAFRIQPARRAYLSWAAVAFIVVSVADFILFDLLEKQVLSL